MEYFRKTSDRKERVGSGTGRRGERAIMGLVIEAQACPGTEDWSPPQATRPRVWGSTCTLVKVVHHPGIEVEEHGHLFRAFPPELGLPSRALANHRSRYARVVQCIEAVQDIPTRYPRTTVVYLQPYLRVGSFPRKTDTGLKVQTVLKQERLGYWTNSWYSTRLPATPSVSGEFCLQSFLRCRSDNTPLNTPHTYCSETRSIWAIC
jgi:hypothetical protein